MAHPLLGVTLSQAQQVLPYSAEQQLLRNAAATPREGSKTWLTYPQPTPIRRRRRPGKPATDPACSASTPAWSTAGGRSGWRSASCNLGTAGLCCRPRHRPGKTSNHLLLSELAPVGFQRQRRAREEGARMRMNCPSDNSPTNPGAGHRGGVAACDAAAPRGKRKGMRVRVVETRSFPLLGCPPLPGAGSGHQWKGNILPVNYTRSSTRGVHPQDAHSQGGRTQSAPPVRAQRAGSQTAQLAWR